VFSKKLKRGEQFLVTTGAYPEVTTRVEIYGNHGSAIIENDQLRFLKCIGI
jgi:hypothetical protein